jgi:hypothetical protein
MLSRTPPRFRLVRHRKSTPEPNATGAYDAVAPAPAERFAPGAVLASQLGSRGLAQPVVDRRQQFGRRPPASTPDFHHVPRTAGPGR